MQPLNNFFSNLASMKKVFFFLCLIFFNVNISFATDTTGLYQKRIQKLKSLSEWLSLKLKNEKIISLQDSLLYNKTLDDAIAKFFDRHFLDSLYKSRGNDDDIFSTSLLFKMMKEFISGFATMTKDIGFDRIPFKNTPYPEEKIESVTSYFLIDNEMFNTLTFVFKENSDILLGVIPNGLPSAKYERYKLYYDSLKIRH